MENTIRTLFLLMIITGTIFTACGPEVKVPASTEDVKPAGSVETNLPESNPTEPASSADSKSAAAPTDSQPVADPVIEVKTKYVDGTYTQTGGYENPAGADSITVTVTIKDDTVQSLNVISNAVNENAQQFQGFFIAGINQQVVGKKIDDAGAIGKVNGSSLTGGGFNKAIGSIRSEALSK